MISAGPAIRPFRKLSMDSGSLKYKGFDCSAFFQGQGKVSIIMYDAHPFSTKAKPGFGLVQWIADEHWSESNPDPAAKYPRLSSQWNEHNGQANTLYVRNGKCCA